MKKGLLEQHIGERFRIVREAYQLSQRLFAERIGKTQGYVSQVENGYVALDVEIIRTVCDVFGISAGWMLSGEGEMEGSTVGERVRMIRRKHSYTQEELAEQAGCSRVAINLIENGKEKPTERLLRKIAEKTWVNEDWLLNGRGEMERKELTEIYELLRRDKGAREAIRSFLERLG